jgi:hypothetical protein
MIRTSFFKRVQKLNSVIYSKKMKQNFYSQFMCKTTDELMNV